MEEEERQSNDIFEIEIDAEVRRQLTGTSERREALIQSRLNEAVETFLLIEDERRQGGKVFIERRGKQKGLFELEFDGPPEKMARE